MIVNPGNRPLWLCVPPPSSSWPCSSAWPQLRRPRVTATCTVVGAPRTTRRLGVIHRMRGSRRPGAVRVNNIHASHVALALTCVSGQYYRLEHVHVAKRSLAGPLPPHLSNPTCPHPLTHVLSPLAPTCPACGRRRGQLLQLQPPLRTVVRGPKPETAAPAPA